ncbi:MAG TPA: ABC transporter substrate-binding protein [Vicinamibacterales bacterium]|nr:ABC transporter substrate-binding protein [Vicinamibacterales bacterium]
MFAVCFPTAAWPQERSRPEFLVTTGETGTYGGQLVVAQRAEPRTLNPVIAVDLPTKDVLRTTIGDLIHINRETQRTEAALAKSWTLSPDGRRYTLVLRQGVRFSDGDPFDADDVVFSFQVYLDPKVASTNRDLLTIDGQPVVVRKVDRYRIEVTLAKPYAAAERIFDGIAMLPRHLLEKAYKEGRFASAWGLNAPPDSIATLGPFRFREYVPGQRLVLERNPHFWKADRAGNQLPYLDRLVFTFVPSEDAQVVRFQSGDADVVTRLSAANYDTLSRVARREYELFDVGASLEYTFVFFNLSDAAAKAMPEVVRKQAWFRRVPFRRAVSLAIDRDAITRIVYRGRATPLYGHVPPGNKLWRDASLPRPLRALERARTLLREANFSWNAQGALVDEKGQAVQFTLVTNSSNAQRVQIATIVQDDLKQIGIDVKVVTLEMRALLDRLLTTGDYDACILGLGGGDADPNAELNVWLSSGTMHLWNPGQGKPATTWEEELDSLMQRQLTVLDASERKRLYDRVQQLVVEYLPIVPLVSPNVLVGAKKGLGNFRPTVLDPHALWNVEELFWRGRRPVGSQ